MDNDAVSFSARFGGVSQQVYIPMAAVLAIHARENGVGTLFPPEPGMTSGWNRHRHPHRLTPSRNHRARAVARP